MARWPEQLLGDVLRPTETVDPTAGPDTPFEYVDVSSVDNVALSIVATQKLLGRDAPSRARRVIRAGDVIFATVRPTLRRIAIVPRALDGQVCSTGYFVLRSGSAMDHRWLFYFLQTDEFMGCMEALQRGASYPAVSDADVRSQRVPVPPLPDQRRIVAILDEAFAAIATAKANADTSILHARAASDGAVDQALRDLVSQLPGKRLCDLVESISTGPFGSLLHKSDYVPGGTPLVNPINIVGDTIEPDTNKAVGPQTAKRLARYRLQIGDVVTARRGEIGRCAVVGNRENGWLCGTGSFFIRPGSLVDGPFLTHLIRSRPYRSRLVAASDRATMPSIGNDDLANLVLHVPDVGAQREMEARFARIANSIRELVQVQSRKLAALDALRSSLLHHAFTGQLTVRAADASLTAAL